MASSVSQRVQKHRDDFAKECLRQSRLLANDPLENDTHEWIQTVAVSRSLAVFFGCDLIFASP